MLAGLLHSSGYYMGPALLEATPSNPKGYFESREVNLLNNELLESAVKVRASGPAGYLTPWRLPRGLLWLAEMSSDTKILATPEQVSLMREHIARRPFCLKDPRFCYTLEAWSRALGDVVHLCVFREPGRTAVSMRKDLKDRPYRGFHLSRRRALNAWTAMYAHVLERYVEDEAWLFIHYEQILDGSAIPRLEQAIETRVDTSFVDFALNRSRDPVGRLPSRTAAVYGELCRLSQLN